jgi:hypothetical protein
MVITHHPLVAGGITGAFVRRNGLAVALKPQDKQNWEWNGLVDAPQYRMTDIRQLQGNFEHLNLGHVWLGGQIDALWGQFVGPYDAIDLLHKKSAQSGGGLGMRVDFGFGHGPGDGSLRRPGEQRGRRCGRKGVQSGCHGA